MSGCVKFVFLLIFATLLSFVISFPPKGGKLNRALTFTLQSCGANKRGPQPCIHEQIGFCSKGCFGDGSAETSDVGSSSSRHTPARNMFANYLVDRRIVPPVYLPSNDKDGYPLSDIDLIWLESTSNPELKFYFGFLDIPEVTLALLKDPDNKTHSPPINRQLVLFTFDHEAVAFLDSETNFYAYYKKDGRYIPRACINKVSKFVEILPKKYRAEDIPVGPQPGIMKKYIVHRNPRPPSQLTL